MLQSLDTLISFVVILFTTSLLVTILVQILSSLLSLRGKNLGNALALTFQSIDPSIGEKAYMLAERILSDPRLSDSTLAARKHGGQDQPTQTGPWGWLSRNGSDLATAIRPDELFSLLQALASEARPQTDDLKQAAGNLLEKLRSTSGGTGAETPGVKALIEFTKKLPAQSVNEEIAAIIQNAEHDVGRLVARIGDGVISAEARLAASFSAAEDRAQQWFQTHARGLTVACSLTLAYVMQLDTVEIYKFVSTNAAARSALVASADQLVEKSGGILEKNGTVFDSIFAAEKKAFPASSLPADLPKSVKTTAELREKISAAMPSADPKTFSAKYDEAEKIGLKVYYDERSKQIADLTKGVAATGFDLLPDQLFGRWPNSPWLGYREHFLGMLISAALLSLGAPFWYNSLKDLLSLRGALSKAISSEKGER